VPVADGSLLVKIVFLVGRWLSVVGVYWQKTPVAQSPSSGEVREHVHPSLFLTIVQEFLRTSEFLLVPEVEKDWIEPPEMRWAPSFAVVDIAVLDFQR
jgi:hypothetical protein